MVSLQAGKAVTALCEGILSSIQTPLSRISPAEAAEGLGYLETSPPLVSYTREPDATHQTSWLARTGECGVQQS